MGAIVLTGVNKYYGSNHVLKNVDLTINDGEFMTLLGPSGCGKTTTLRVISGLEKPQDGTITMDDKLIVNAKEQFFEPPSKRGLNLVFQSYALWPHMTVFDNVAFGLKVNHTPKAEIKKLVESALERMQIAEFAERYPSELSGGQQQRVAIARAIASTPKLLLLDEPLSNLDAKLRVDMRSELKRLHQEMGTTIIYVTHDQVEALTLSTRIAVFFDGHIEQVDTPMSLYQNPATIRIADFIGNPKINLIKASAKISGENLEVACAFGNLSFPKACLINEISAGGECKVGFRPEEIVISKTKTDGSLEAKVYSSMPAGSETLVRLSIGDDAFLAKRLGLKHYKVDEKVFITIPHEKLNVFDVASGKLIKKADETDDE